MALASLDNVKRRVIRILNANPTAWATTVSGEIGAFPDTDEITAAILEADSIVITKGYFQSVNSALAQRFMVLSSATIPSGDKLPEHYGKHGKVVVSATDSNYLPGVEAQSRDDVINAISLGSYVQSNAFDQLYFIDENKVFYHVATYGKVEIPTFTRTAALQANESEESLIIATAIRLLTKHASNALFENYIQESKTGLQQLVSDGAYKPGAAVEA